MITWVKNYVVNFDRGLWNIIKLSAFILFLFCAVEVCGKLAGASGLEVLRETTVHLDRGTGSLVHGRSGGIYLLTNWHVCNVSQYKHMLYASYPNGEMVSGRVVKADPTKDLCAAKIKGSYTALKLAPMLLPDKVCCTRGYPGHIPSESCGKIGDTTKWPAGFGLEEIGECPAQFHQDRDFEGRVRGCTYTFTSTLTSLYARPGSSGSPVVDSQGLLIGVVSSWHQQSDYEAGMVTFHDLKEFLRDL